MITINIDKEILIKETKFLGCMANNLISLDYKILTFFVLRSLPQTNQIQCLKNLKKD